uniref:Uncharacterized protein n=1 Tax=Trichogramma kaykai TaxID=54128 RepID=A0ABD2WKZ7_9HYME
MSKSNFKDDSGLRYGSKDVFERYKGRSPDYSSELKRMLDEEELDWENEEQRYYFSCRLYFLIKNWKSQLPDLRQFLRNDQMDWLITEDVKNKYDPNHANKGTPIINFVIKTGYKDKTEIDNDGKPILRRTTAIHLAAKNGYNLVAPLLFKIYDSFDANYVDEDDSAGGLTHFHAACAFGYEKIVEKFLEAGQDPNCPLSDDPPLHLALKHEHKKVVEVLLKRGANPNSTSRSGQKSLQIAVANLAPDSVKLLLDHGADLADFAFPAGSQFNERLATVTSKGHSMKLEIASLIMMIVEHLERRGYAFAPNRSDVLTIVELLSKYEWFNQFSIEYWLSNEDFVIKAKELKMKPSLSLYDFVRLPAEQATRLVTYKEYFNVKEEPTDVAFSKNDSEVIDEKPDVKNIQLLPHLPENSVSVDCCIHSQTSVISTSKLMRCTMVAIFEKRLCGALRIVAVNNCGKFQPISSDSFPGKQDQNFLSYKQ